MVDEDLLEQVTRLLGHKSYSAAINFSLAETLRQARVKDLWSYVGSGVWDGDLAAMRGDRADERPALRGDEVRGGAGEKKAATRRARASRTP